MLLTRLLLKDSRRVEPFAFLLFIGKGKDGRCEPFDRERQLNVDEEGMVTSASHQGKGAPSHEGNEGLLREASFGLKGSSGERVDAVSSPTPSNPFTF